VTNYNNPTTQAERLAALHNDRLRDASTLLDHVSNDSGGRFAVIGKPTVIGSEPSAQYPTLPSSSPWAADPVGVEPPTGVEIGAMEPVGEGFEVERSLAEIEASLAEVALAEDVDPASSAVETPRPIPTHEVPLKIKRRRIS
jgi:hypothetical protein